MAIDPLQPIVIGRSSRCTYASSLLTKEEKAQLQQVLTANADVFAWNHTDMTGVNPENASHKLSVLQSSRTILQKVRRFHLDRHQIIQTEVDNLLKAGFIREVKYSEWLTNVVVVPKKRGKWQVCVDYTDLNDACPKDNFPLPRIDQIVDASTGHFAAVIFICILRLSLDPHVPARRGENIFHHPSQALLLQRNALRVIECRSHLSAIGNQDVSTAARENYGSVYKRYVDKVQGTPGPR